MKTIQIGNKQIGAGHTYIIAEIGSNHTRDIEIAFAHIDAAVECGADAVKFQSLQLNELYHKPSAEITELHRQIDLPEEWHQPLMDYCNQKGIDFFSAPTYLKSVDILEQTGVKLYKLASAQIGTFPQIVRKVAALQKPVILSTGLVNQDALDRVMEIFREEGNDQIIILHCNSIYPAPYDRLNLPIINQYRERYGVQIGFSDHTEDSTGAIAAVALGATVLEKHFTLSRRLPTPDAPFALEPDEMKNYISEIRKTEKAMVFRERSDIQPEEAAFKQRILYRLILKNSVSKGAQIGFADVDFLRYPEGVDARDFFNAGNKVTALTDLQPGLINPQNIEF
ncbi:MAG: N-acetylneuraminate synthase family protein [Bacteroidia bacterium]